MMAAAAAAAAGDGDPTRTVVVVAGHGCLAAILGVLAAASVALTSTPAGSFVVQFVSIVALMVTLIWVWTSGVVDMADSGCGGAMVSAKSVTQKAASSWVWAWRGARVGLILFALWLTWGLLEVGLLGGTASDDVVTTAAAAGGGDNPLSWSWLTGTVALVMAMTVAVLAYLPAVVHHWPDLCRYLLGPLVLLLVLLPNQGLLLDPRLWEISASSSSLVAVVDPSTWVRLASAIPRAVGIYLLFVLSWHTLVLYDDDDDNGRRQRFSHPLACLRRTSICLCRVLWITQTASPVIVAVGIVGSLGTIVSHILIGDSRHTSSSSSSPLSRRRRRSARDPELGIAVVVDDDDDNNSSTLQSQPPPQQQHKTVHFDLPLPSVAGGPHEAKVGDRKTLVT